MLLTPAAGHVDEFSSLFRFYDVRHSDASHAMNGTDKHRRLLASAGISSNRGQ
jgi:hypothetical protein